MTTLPLDSSAATSTEPTAPVLAASGFQLCPHMQLATARLDVDVSSLAEGAEAAALHDGHAAALQHHPSEVTGGSAHSRLNTTREEPSK